MQNDSSTYTVWACIFEESHALRGFPQKYIFGLSAQRHKTAESHWIKQNPWHFDQRLDSDDIFFPFRMQATLNVLGYLKIETTIRFPRLVT